MIVTGDHIGTHIDSWGHVKPDAPRAEGIPIEYCYGDGVVLNLTHKAPGDEDHAGRHRGGGTQARRATGSSRWTSCCSGPTPKTRTEKSYLTIIPA